MGQAVQTFRFTSEVTLTFTEHDLHHAISDKIEIMAQQGTISSAQGNFWLQSLLEKQLTHEPFAHYWALRKFCQLTKNGSLPPVPAPQRPRTLRERLRQFFEP